MQYAMNTTATPTPNTDGDGAVGLDASPGHVPHHLDREWDNVPGGMGCEYAVTCYCERSASTKTETSLLFHLLSNSQPNFT